jgi:hypothetical protein
MIRKTLRRHFFPQPVPFSTTFLVDTWIARNTQVGG